MSDDRTIFDLSEEEYEDYENNPEDWEEVAKTEHSHPLGIVVSTHFRCGKVRIFYK